MKTQPLSQNKGEPVRRPDVAADDGLYRYVPVPPVYRDEDGYLVEDGAGQEDRHFSQTSLWYLALNWHLPTATVCSNLCLHYEQGDTSKTLVPDLFVALRAPRPEDRQTYKLWEEPVPELVIEMLSKDTADADVGSKRFTCEHLGVREYWLFDPEGLALPTPVAGNRLHAGRYRPISADATGRFPSEVLGLDLHVQAGDLRFRDPATGENLRTYEESVNEMEAAKRRAAATKRQADAEELRWAAEKRRADAAERELARLRLRLAES